MFVACAATVEYIGVVFAFVEGDAVGIDIDTSGCVESDGR